MKKELKKVLSMGLAIAMAAVNAVAVSADGESQYADYVPGDKNENLIADASAGNGYTYFNNRNDSNVFTSNQSNPSPETGTVKLYTNVTVEGDTWRNFIGLELNSNQLATKYFSPEAGKTYVLKMSLKDVSESGVTSYFGASMNDTYDSSKTRYTKEYGSTGMLVGSDWTDFKGTISLPDTYTPDQYHGKVISIGFPNGTASGAAILIDAREKDSAYLAEEQVYDITSKISSSKVKQGGELTAEAAVVNQIGTVGSIEQDIEWFVTDADRTEKITDGFEITEGENQTVTVKIAEDAEVGDYVLIASSEQNGGMYKGAEFSVKENKWPDFVTPKKNENIIPDASAGNGYTYFNNRDCSQAATSNDKNPSPETKTVKLYTTDTVAGDAWRLFQGLELNSAQLATRYFSPTAGKTYVLKMSLKDVSESGVTSYFGASMNDTYGPANTRYTNEYGSTGMLVGSDWTDFKGTISLPDTYKPDQYFGKVISIGFPNGTAKDAAILIDAREKDSAYLAEEQLYEFNIDADKASVSRGETMTATAELLNQIGVKGSFTQEFDWFVANEEETEKADGFIVTASGNTVTVMPKYSVLPGKYVLIAYSEENNTYMSYEFTVADADYYVDYAPTKMNENIIPDASAGNGWTYFNSRNCSPVGNANGTADDVSKTNIKYYTSDTVSTENWRTFGGFELNSTQLGDNRYFSPVAGKTYVLKMSLKDVSESGVPSYIGASMTHNYDPRNLVYTNEYGAAGMLVGSDWTEFAGSLTLPDKFNVAAAPGNIISIGYPTGTEKGAAVLLDVSTKDSVYLAEEQAYKITVAKSNEQESSVDLTAEVTNQLGKRGGLSQEFEWAAVRSDRKTKADGITITEKESSSSVTVSWENVTESGDYIIAAVSEDGSLVKTTEISVTVARNARTIYVSNTGNDSADGTADAPLATLAGAKAKVREIKNSGYTGDIDVIFAGGKYYVSSTVEFTADDSGTESTKITYKAADGADVVFTGAVELDLSKAEKVKDSAILARLKDGVGDKVVAIDLTKEGYASIKDETIVPSFNALINGSYEYPGLYLNGNEQTLAQWPNGQNEYSTWSYVSEDTIGYSDAEPSTWKDASDWWIGGYMDYDYSYSRMPAVSVDTENKQITLTTGNSVTVRNSKTEKTYRWKAFNLLEELDAPTEWWIDRENNILYYYLPEHDDSSKLEISVLKSSMIKLNNADNIAFSGITFENTRASAISALNIEDVDISDCTFKNIGTNALYIYGSQNAETDKDYWQVQRVDASYNVNVLNNKFNNIGGYAIYMEGGNVDTLKKSGNVIENNIIYKASQKIKDFNSVELRGCEHTVRYNNISCTNDQAIRFYGNDHVISYNEIHDVVQDSDDAGAIYSGRNTIQRGTEISYNYIHDTFGTFEAVFGHKPAIYWDDGQTGMSAHHNIIKNAYQNVYTNGVDNNYSYNTSIGIKSKDIYFTDAGFGAASNCGDDCTVEGCDKTVFHGTFANKELYLSSYPTLSTILGKSSLKDRSLGGLNTILGNVTAESDAEAAIGNNAKYPNATYLETTMIVQGTANTKVANPTTIALSSFADAAAQDYRIKGTSGTGVLDESFDIDLIGVQSKNTIDKSTVEIAGPAENEKLNDSTVKFVWYNNLGATSYKVEVATDAAMTNVIKTAEVDYNYEELEVPTDGRTYYWKVTAYNNSREFAGSWTSDVHSFTNGDKISAETEISGTSVSLKLTNNYYEGSKAAVVYLAEYNSEDRVLAVQMFDATLVKGVENSVADSITLKNQDAAKVILYIWDAANSPLENAVKVK